MGVCVSLVVFVSVTVFECLYVCLIVVGTFWLSLRGCECVSVFLSLCFCVCLCVECVYGSLFLSP